MLSATKPLCLKIRRSISGSGIRSSSMTKPASTTAPAATQPQVAAELQPHWPACWSPSTARPIPRKRARRRASRWARACAHRADCARRVNASAITAIGTLIQKIERHVHCSRKLPAIGPTDVSPPVIPKKMASALPRSRGSKLLTTIASAAGNSTRAERALHDTEADQPRTHRPGPSAPRRRAPMLPRTRSRRR